MRGARKISWGSAVVRQRRTAVKTSLLVSGPPQLIFMNTNIIVWGNRPRIKLNVSGKLGQIIEN